MAEIILLITGYHSRVTRDAKMLGHDPTYKLQPAFGRGIERSQRLCFSADASELRAGAKFGDGV